MFRMLSFAVVLILFVGGSQASIPECLMREARSSCTRVESIIPDTPQKMDDLCSQAIGQMKCMKSFSEKCDLSETDPDIEALADLVRYLETDLCNQNSRLYRTVSSNVKCMTGAVDRAYWDVCREMLRSADEKNATSIIGVDVFDKDRFGGRRMDRCAESLIEIICLASEIEESCGKDAGRAFSSMGVRLEQFKRECPRELLEEVPHFIRAADEVEENIENTIRRRK